MERVKRVQMLLLRAKESVQRGGEPHATLAALQEAIALLRKIETDMSRFRDWLAPTR